MKITGIRYELYLTYEEVETLKKHMEESNWAETVVIPFYDKDGHYDPNMYEALTVNMAQQDGDLMARYSAQV